MTVLGWAIFHSIWHGAVIGAVAAMALAALRCSAASTRYAVAFGALLALPAASGLTILQALGLPVGPFLTAPFARILTVLTPIAPWVAAAWVAGVSVASLRLAGGWMRIGPASGAKHVGRCALAEGRRHPRGPFWNPPGRQAGRNGRR